jgi:hypothetical protein
MQYTLVKIGNYELKKYDYEGLTCFREDEIPSEWQPKLCKWMYGQTCTYVQERIPAKNLWHRILQKVGLAKKEKCVLLYYSWDVERWYRMTFHGEATYFD